MANPTTTKLPSGYEVVSAPPKPTRNYQRGMSEEELAQIMAAVEGGQWVQLPKTYAERQKAMDAGYNAVWKLHSAGLVKDRRDLERRAVEVPDGWKVAIGKRQ